MSVTFHSVPPRTQDRIRLTPEKTMSPEELKAKIDLLHSRLNEYYELDDSWRTIGQWPEGEHGSILHPPATEEEIVQAEARFGHTFPPSYKEFLRLH